MILYDEWINLCDKCAKLCDLILYPNCVILHFWVITIYCTFRVYAYKLASSTVHITRLPVFSYVGLFVLSSWNAGTTSTRYRLLLNQKYCKEYSLTGQNHVLVLPVVAVCSIAMYSSTCSSTKTKAGIIDFVRDVRKYV